MPIPPERSLIFRRAPDWLRDGTGERLLYLFGLSLDASLDRSLASVEASDPTRANDSCLAEIGKDVLIPRGLTEATRSYGTRLQKALDAWQQAGFSRAVLGQVLGFLLGAQPRIRLVSTRYERDPGREMALAAAVGADVVSASNASPIVITTAAAHGFATGWTVTIAGVSGNVAALGSHVITVLSATAFSLNGTTTSGVPGTGGTVIGSPGAVAYPPAPLASQWETYEEGADPDAAPVHVVGTIGGDGEWDWDSLSQVDGSWSYYGGWVIIESFGNNFWIHQSLPLDTPGVPGLDDPDGPALDFLEGPERVNSIQAILRLWKTAGLWIRNVIVTFDESLFSPADPAGGGSNPNGYFGIPGRVVDQNDGDGPQYVYTRFVDAVFCDGVI